MAVPVGVISAEGTAARCSISSLTEAIGVPSAAWVINVTAAHSQPSSESGVLMETVIVSPGVSR